MAKDNKLNFTIATLNALPTPSAGRSYHYDNKVNGLGVMIFPSSTKTFFLYKRVNGKPDKIKIGRFPEITIEQARKIAHSMLNDICHGVDPTKSKLKSEPIFDELFDRYINEYAKHHKISWEDDMSRYDKHVAKTLAKKPISQISKLDIQSLHNKTKETVGHHTANRVLALLSTVFSKAIEWGCSSLNPASGIKKFAEQSRDRALQPEEISCFMQSLNDEPDPILRSYFYISLLTGARRDNVLSMRWDELLLDSDEPCWRIPKTKNGESQVVALVPEACLMLSQLHEHRNSEWVFASQKSKTGHLVEPKSAWKRILQRANINNLRIHDLRRTMASWQVRTGANSFVIGKTLGHKTQQATAIYAQVSKDVTRESMEKAVRCMFGKFEAMSYEAK